MIFILLLSLLLADAPQANKSNEPLVSATNPTYLSCTFWTGKGFSKLEARSARTPAVRSPKGFLAYGEVKVEVQGEDCENTTTLYVAAGEGKEFKAVYKKDGGGNGIRIIGWSPSGERLLAEITSWIYESDTGFEYTPVIFDAATSTAQENSVFEQALKDHLGNCSYEHNVTHWKTNTQVLVKVSPYLDAQREESTEDTEKLFKRRRNLQSATHDLRRWLPSRLIPHRHCPRGELQPAHEL